MFLVCHWDVICSDCIQSPRVKLLDFYRPGDQKYKSVGARCHHVGSLDDFLCLVHRTGCIGDSFQSGNDVRQPRNGVTKYLNIKCSYCGFFSDSQGLHFILQPVNVTVCVKN